MNPIHQIADGRERMLAAVVKVTGIPEASIIGRGRMTEVVSARRIIDFGLTSLGWTQAEIADVVYGVESHCGVSYRMEKPLNETERANLAAALLLSESRPAMPEPRRPDEAIENYIIRVVAHTMSVEHGEVFSDNRCTRVLNARAVAAWVMNKMGVSYAAIVRRVSKHRWNESSCVHWKRRVESSHLLPIAERTLAEMRRQVKEAA